MDSINPEIQPYLEMFECAGSDEERRAMIARFKNTGRAAAILENRLEEDYEFVTLADLQARPPDPIQWVVEDLFPVGGIAILSGRPKVGKSTLVRGLVRRVASPGEPENWIGRCVQERGRVGYFALQESERYVRQAFRSLENSTAAPEIDLVFRTRGKNTGERLHRYIKARAPRLVVLDTVGKWLGSRSTDGNDYAETGVLLGELEDVARLTDTLILLIHHDRKAVGDDMGSSLLGSTAFAGTADTVLMMTRDKEDRRTVHSINRVGKDLVKTIVNAEANVMTTKDQADQDGYKAKIIRALESADKPLTATLLRSAAGVRGGGSFNRARDDLVEAGIVEKVKGDRNQKTFRLAPGRAASETIPQTDETAHNRAAPDQQDGADCFPLK